MQRSTWEPTAPLGRAGAEEQQAAASPWSSAAMGSGTALRRGRTKKAAGVAVPTSLLADWPARETPLPVTWLAGRCVTRQPRGATTSCTAPTAATRGTALCVSRGPSIATASGRYSATVLDVGATETPA